MRYLVAVSGGVDSVVLLDKLAKLGDHYIIVAHFDHGIRAESAADARFVGELARRYDFPFVTKREELGPDASEDKARSRRYEFLRQAAQKHKALIATAHHKDDVVETIAINLQRGTGWRGLKVLAAKDVARPLIKLSKIEIYDYACQNRLEWVEDSTNASNKYLRNRLRQHTAKLPKATRDELLKLRQRQTELAAEISKETGQLLSGGEAYNRHLFVHSDESSALELLRAVIKRRGHTPPTRPQLERALLAVKTARHGAKHSLGGKVSLHFTARSFIVRTS